MPSIRKYTKDFGYSYSFGVFPTLELLTHRPEHVIKVVISPKGYKNHGIEEIQLLARKNHIEIEKSEGIVEKISGSENTYCFGIFKKFENHIEKNTQHVILVSPSDMGNLGTIMRTSLGFGYKDVVIIKPAADIFDPRTVRASMGSLFTIRFQYFSTFKDYQQQFPEQHLYSFMKDAKVSLEEASFEKPFSLIFGNESSGLSGEFRSVGTSIAIPQTKLVDSLNLSIAVGVGLFEAQRKAL